MLAGAEVWLTDSSRVGSISAVRACVCWDRGRSEGALDPSERQSSFARKSVIIAGARLLRLDLHLRGTATIMATLGPRQNPT